MKMEITFLGGKKVAAQYEGFIITTDQPVDEGGTNSAPSPFTLFLASIGTCTAYYVLGFCQARNIPMDNITVNADIQRNSKTHMVETIAIDIHVPKNFPDHYKQPLIKAAEKCTVKRHLETPPKITTEVTKS